MTITISNRDFWTYLVLVVGIAALIWSVFLPSVTFHQTLVNDGAKPATVTTVDLVNARATVVRLRPGQSRVVKVHVGEDTEREYAEPYLVIVADADGNVLSTTSLTGRDVAECSFHIATATTRPIERDQ